MQGVLVIANSLDFVNFERSLQLNWVVKVVRDEFLLHIEHLDELVLEPAVDFVTIFAPILVVLASLKGESHAFRHSGLWKCTL